MKTTVWLFVAFVLLWGAVGLVRQHHAARKPSAWPDRPLLSIGPDEATAVQIESPDLEVRIERHGNDWFLVRPLRARASSSAVEHILTILDMSFVRDAVTEAQRRERDLTLDAYGLVSPRAIFKVEAGYRREGVVLGDDAPLEPRLFAKRLHGSDVLVVESTILDAIPPEIDVLRDRHLIRGRQRHVRRVDIHAAGRGFIQLTRRQDRWRIEQPVSAAADDNAVQRMLTAIFNIKALDFFWDEDTVQAEGTVTASALSKYEACGLAEDIATLRIGVWTEGDALGQELLFGARSPTSSDRVYARRRDVNAIYEVDVQAMDTFLVHPDTLRDRRVLFHKPDEALSLRIEHKGQILDMRAVNSDNWGIREPVEWKADPIMVRQTLESLHALRVSQFAESPDQGDTPDANLDPPLWRIVIGYGDGQTKELRVGAPSGLNENRWMAIENGTLQMDVDARLLDDLLKHGANPLRYRDRMVLELPPASIWRLERASATHTQRIERVNDQWIISAGHDEQVRANAAASIVGAVSTLRAESIEAQNPPELAVYGLDPASLTLTIGLRGDAGIRKTLYFGFLATTGGVYTRLRGQDLVFVLDRNTVDILTTSLTTRPPPSPNTSAAP